MRRGSIRGVVSTIAGEPKYLLGFPFVPSNSSSKVREEDFLHFSMRLALRNGWLSLATPTVELAAGPGHPPARRSRGSGGALWGRIGGAYHHHSHHSGMTLARQGLRQQAGVPGVQPLAPVEVPRR